MLFLSCRGLRGGGWAPVLLPFLGFVLWSSCLVFVCDIHVHYFDCPRRDVVCLGSETVSCMTIAERSEQAVKAESFPGLFLLIECFGDGCLEK